MTKESFGAFIREKREQAGISKAELARRASMTRAYIGFIEDDSQPPGMGAPNVSAKNLSALARELDVPEAEMFERGYRSPAGFKLVPSGSPADQLVRELLDQCEECTGVEFPQRQMVVLADDIEDYARHRLSRTARTLRLEQQEMETA